MGPKKWLMANQGSSHSSSFSSLELLVEQVFKRWFAVIGSLLGRYEVLICMAACHVLCLYKTVQVWVLREKGESAPAKGILSFSLKEARASKGEE